MQTQVKERPILFQGAMVRALLDGTKTQTRRVLKSQPPEGCGIHYMLGNESWLDEADRTPLRHHWEAWGGPLYQSRPKGHLCGTHSVKCPYGKPGDRLVVRETWQYADWTEDGLPWIGYAADGAKQVAHLVQSDSDGWGEKLHDIWAELSSAENIAIDGRAADRRWRPSIHMPRWASRILLEIVSVRVERLNDCSEEDARAEGATHHEPANHLSHGGWSHDGHYVHATALASYEKLWESINGPGSWAANSWVWVVEFRRITP